MRRRSGGTEGRFIKCLLSAVRSPYCFILIGPFNPHSNPTFTVILIKKKTKKPEALSIYVALSKLQSFPFYNSVSQRTF